MATAAPDQGVAVLDGPGADGVSGQWPTHHNAFGKTQAEMLLKHRERETFSGHG